jgi:SAGA-associated factor 29
MSLSTPAFVDRSSDTNLSSVEVEYWSHIAASLSTLSNMNPATEQTIGRVNRLISALPTDDTLQVDGLDSAKTTHKKLSLGLDELRKQAEAEVK